MTLGKAALSVTIRIYGSPEGEKYIIKIHKQHLEEGHLSVQCLNVNVWFIYM